MSDAPFIPLRFQRLPESEMRKRADAFFGTADRRRSVRSFSEDAVPLDVVETCIRSAGTAPSGAHKQPWTFALITDPAIKTKIREAAEEEERENYGRRMNEEWLDDLRPFKTDAEKAF
ncbi:MAG: nitroreductase, partial [Planctomycetota bacterium]